MTKVWVVQGNDFPAAVFSTENVANEYCDKKKLEDNPSGRKIYWRSYEFELDHAE